MKPTREQIEEACRHIEANTLVDHKYALSHEDKCAIGTLLATHDERPDPRPDDMAELARQVAARLRKTRSTVAVAEHVLVARVTGQNPNYRPTLGYYTMTASDFNNLNAIEIADLIQAEEARRAQELAGDE